MALINDTFIRGNQNGWGTASDGVTVWSRGNGGGGSDTSNLVTITSNTGQIAFNNSYTPVSYTSLSQQNNLKITFSFQVVSTIPSGGVIFICSKSGGNTNRDGVGLYIFSGTTSNILLADNGTTKATGSFTFTTGTLYDLELDINTDYSMNLYVWAHGGSKPGTPTLSCATFTPGASGTNFQIGNSGNSTSTGTVQFTTLTVSVQGSAVNSNFLVFM